MDDHDYEENGMQANPVFSPRVLKLGIFSLFNFETTCHRHRHEILFYLMTSDTLELGTGISYLQFKVRLELSYIRVILH